MLLAAGLAIAGVAVYKHKEKKVEWRRSHLNDVHGGQTLRIHVQNGSERQQVNCSQTDDPNVLVQKRIIFANLVHGMYERCKKPKSDYKQYWEKHYELVPLQEILTSKELDEQSHFRLQRYIKKEEENKYFGVFHKKKTLWNPAAPEWVVAIRGTLKLRVQDYVNDIKISVEKLHTSSTIKLLKIVISQLLEKLGFDPKGSKLTEQGTQRDIHNLGASLALTGHSLGAAQAMLVARKFALRGYLLDSHFFNPPFATLTAMARFWARKFFSPIFGKKLRDNCRSFVMSISNGFNYCLDGGKKMKKQRAEYQALTHWSPYLYLNEYDPICGLYIPHFLRRRLKKVRIQTNDAWYSFGSALLGVTFGSAKTFHLMPRAICCIARTKSGHTYIHGLFSAHKLENWTRDDVPIIVHQSNLEVEVNLEEELITEKVAGEDIEEDLAEEEGEEEQESDWREEEADDGHHSCSPSEEGREQDCGESTESEPTPERVQAEMAWGRQTYGLEYPRESIGSEPTPERVQAEVAWGRQTYCLEYPRESIGSEPTPERVQAEVAWGRQTYGLEYPRESIGSEPTPVRVQAEVAWGHQSYGLEYPREWMGSKPTPGRVQAEVAWGCQSYGLEYPRQWMGSEPTPERVQAEVAWERQTYGLEYPRGPTPERVAWERQTYGLEYPRGPTPERVTWERQGYWECMGTKESIEASSEPVQSEWRHVSYVSFQIDSEPTRKHVEAVWEREDFCWACVGPCRESIEPEPTDEPVQAAWGRQGYYSEYAQESTESKLTHERAPVQAEWGRQSYF